MKEMTSVATTMMTEEERSELERGLNTPSGEAGLKANGHGAAVSGVATPTAQPTESTPTPAPAAPQPQHATTDTLHPDNQGANTAASGQSLVHAPSPSPGTPDSKSTSSGGAGAGSAVAEGSGAATPSKKKRSKLSPEQKLKLQEIEDERRKNMEERITLLSKKLAERLRPFVEAKHPGEDDDPETIAFKEKMKREAEDLKLESFGVELLHTIGSVYVMKGTSFLKSKKFLGM